jgi:signal transduction histidine kinase/CheY-like chemotaxis protein
MKESVPSPESELLISPKPVLAALTILGLLLYLAAEMLFWQTVGQAMSFLLLLSALSSAAWLLVGWRPWLGRWLTVLALMVTVNLAGPWVGSSGSLAWAVIPSALAVPLIGFPAAAVVAVGESVLVFALVGYSTMGYELSEAIVAVVAAWIVLGGMCVVYQLVRQRIVWLDEYFEREQRFLEEARDHRAELEQALDDLAHANRQLALMNERVNALRLIAEEAQKAKTRFVARVSHEFRTPLNMIIGLVDLMVETPEIYDMTPSPRMREALQVVYRNCQHLSDMVNDVLDLTRIESDRMVLHREQVDIGQVVDSAVEAVRPLLESKHLALHLAISGDVPELCCDRTRIEQVVLNLMSNAARYTEKGEIAVAVDRWDQYIRVSVRDTGPGISSKDLDRIFEPFSQGTSDFWRDKGGSGLGLSISKQFVELHSGRMWAESELGVGTTLTFELPISSPIGLVGRPGHQIQENWVWRERQSKPRLPDSHYDLRFVICDETGDLYAMLARRSHEIEFADTRSLAQAIKVVQQAPAHAILLNTAAFDDAWPQVEVLRQEVAGMPVIGCSVPPRIERAIALGALGHLIKPVTRADLKQAIQMVGSPVGRVLVVDDDPGALELFSCMLTVCDGTLEVIAASSGEEALERLRRDSPDLMLLDIVMSDIDGWHVLESMAQDEGIPKVPTFLMSAQDPSDQPPRSSFLLATIDEGLSLNKLLCCSLEVSKLLLQPEGTLHPALE